MLFEVLLPNFDIIYNNVCFISLLQGLEGTKIFKTIGTLVAGLLLFFWGTLPVGALSRTIGVETLGMESDMQVMAPASSIVLDFPIPRMTQIKAATATVFVTPGAQLNSEAVFFFHYNDKLIATRTAKELLQQKSVVLNLPVDKVVRNFARLQIKSSMFMTNDLCRDYYSGGLFFVVHRNSFLNLTYDMPPVRSVEDFFGSLQQDLLVVVPDDASLAEFVPAAWTYGLLKKAQPHLNIQLVRAAELLKLPRVPRIWIGLDAKLPKYFKGATAGVMLADPNTLLISATDVQSLRTFVQQLLDLPVLSLNTKSDQRISITPIETPPGVVNEAIAFGNNNLQEGIFSVPAEFQLYPVALEKIPERLGFHLEGSHTLPADTGRPVRMDVFLNNNLVYSSVLDRTGQFTRDILLQEPVELLSLNTLKIQFNYPEDPTQCKVRGKFQVAQILPTSYMWGAGQYRVDRFDWNNIGLFLGRQGTILLDEALGVDMLKIAGETAYFLNRQLPPGVVAFPNYLPLKQPTELPEGGFVLVAGITGNIPSILQDKMPVSVDKDFDVYRKTTKVRLFEHQPNVNAVVGRVGEFKGGPVVIFSANTDGGLLNDALRHLSRPKTAETLTGNVLVYQKNVKLYSFDVRDKNVKNQKPVAKEMTVADIWEQHQTLILVVVGIVALLLLLGIPAFLKMFPRKKVKREPGRTDSSKETLFK